ncbi:MAG: multiprotein bridging factor aMBF1 [Nanoarchaeota archaeon]
MSCELCGKADASLLAEVEGVDLQVCAQCVRYGTIKKRPAAANSARFSPSASVKLEEPEYTIVSNYAFLLRTVREKKELSQQDFAKFLNERESVVAKLEAGSLKPGLETARKLERKLGIKLVELEQASAGRVEPKRKSEELTLGDLVKVRKRK